MIGNCKEVTPAAKRLVQPRVKAFLVFLLLQGLEILFPNVIHADEPVSHP